MPACRWSERHGYVPVSPVTVAAPPAATVEELPPDPPVPAPDAPDVPDALGPLGVPAAPCVPAAVPVDDPELLAPVELDEPAPADTSLVPVASLCEFPGTRTTSMTTATII